MAYHFHQRFSRFYKKRSNSICSTNIFAFEKEATAFQIANMRIPLAVPLATISSSVYPGTPHHAHPVRPAVIRSCHGASAEAASPSSPILPPPAYLSWFCKLGTHGGERREKAVGHQPGFSPPSSHSRFVQCERDSLFLVPTKPTPPPPKKKEKSLCVLHVKLLSLLGAIPPHKAATSWEGENS